MQEFLYWLWYACIQSAPKRRLETKPTLCFSTLFPLINFSKILTSIFAFFMIATLSSTAEAGKNSKKNNQNRGQGSSRQSDQERYARSKELDYKLEPYEQNMNEIYEILETEEPELYRELMEANPDDLDSKERLWQWIYQTYVAPHQEEPENQPTNSNVSPALIAAPLIPAALVASAKLNQQNPPPQTTANNRVIVPQTPAKQSGGGRQNPQAVNRIQQAPVTPQRGNGQNNGQNYGQNGQQKQGQQNQRTPLVLAPKANGKATPPPPPPRVVESMRVQPQRQESTILDSNLVAINSTYDPNLPSTEVPGLVRYRPETGLKPGGGGLPPAVKVKTLQPAHNAVALLLAGIMDIRIAPGEKPKSGPQLRAELSTAISVVLAVLGKRAGKLPEGVLIENEAHWVHLTDPFAGKSWNVNERLKALMSISLKEGEHPIALSERMTDSPELFRDTQVQTRVRRLQHEIDREAKTKFVERLKSLGDTKSEAVSDALLAGIFQAFRETMGGGLSGVPRGMHTFTGTTRWLMRKAKGFFEKKAEPTNPENVVYETEFHRWLDNLDWSADNIEGFYNVLRSETMLMDALRYVQELLDGDVDGVSAETVEDMLSHFNTKLADVVEKHLVKDLQKYDYRSHLHHSSATDVSNLIEKSIKVGLRNLSPEIWKQLVYEVLRSPADATSFDTLTRIVALFNLVSVNYMQHAANATNSVKPEIAKMGRTLSSSALAEAPEEIVETLRIDPAFLPGTFEGVTPPAVEDAPVRHSSFDKTRRIKLRILEKTSATNTLDDILERSKSSSYIHVVDLDLKDEKAGKINQVYTNIIEVESGIKRKVVWRIIKRSVLDRVRLGEEEGKETAITVAAELKDPHQGMRSADPVAVNRYIDIVGEMVAQDTDLAAGVREFEEARVRLTGSTVHVDGDKIFRVRSRVPVVYDSTPGSNIMVMEQVEKLETISELVAKRSRTAPHVAAHIAARTLEDAFFPLSKELAFQEEDIDSNDHSLGDELEAVTPKSKRTSEIHLSVHRTVEFARTKGIVLDPKTLQVVSSTVEKPMSMAIDLRDVIGEESAVIRTLGNLISVLISSGAVRGEGVAHRDPHQYNYPLTVEGQDITVNILDVSLEKIPVEFQRALSLMNVGLIRGWTSFINKGIEDLIRAHGVKARLKRDDIERSIRDAIDATHKRIEQDARVGKETSLSDLLTNLFLFYQDIKLPESLLRLKPALAAIGSMVETAGSASSEHGAAALWAEINEELARKHTAEIKRQVLSGGIVRNMQLRASAFSETCRSLWKK